MALSIQNIEESPVGDEKGKTKKEYESFDHKKKRHLHQIAIISIWILFAIAVFVFIIRAIHFIFPECWCWLNAEKLQNIDKFLFSGAFGGILAKYAKYIFTNTNSE